MLYPASIDCKRRKAGANRDREKKMTDCRDEGSTGESGRYLCWQSSMWWRSKSTWICMKWNSSATRRLNPEPPMKHASNDHTVNLQITWSLRWTWSYWILSPHYAQSISNTSFDGEFEPEPVPGWKDRLQGGLHTGFMPGFSWLFWFYSRFSWAVFDEISYIDHFLQSWIMQGS